jgi:RNA polymerase sigma-70 factor (ECF subfamily)
MEQDTVVKSGQSGFPTTSWSALALLRDSKDPRFRAYLSRMMESYWRPVYKFIRIAWKRSNEDAKDLTQAFFVHIMEGDLFSKADPERGNFRRLLMTSLRNFLANEVRAGHAIKRGGGRQVLSLDVEESEDWASDPANPEQAFEAQWARDVLQGALEKLAQVVRAEAYDAFRKFHLEEAAVKDIARDLGVTDAQVGHYLHEARTELRRIVIDEIKSYVVDESEIARELDTLFKGWR